MPGRIDFSFDFHANKQDAKKNQGDSFNMLLLGDFSGAKQLNMEQSLRQVDLDSFEVAISRIVPQVRVSLPPPYSEEITISFNEFEDFHPDQLYNNLDIFAVWRDLRKQLLNPDTFAQAASKIKQILSTASDAGNGDNGAIIKESNETQTSKPNAQGSDSLFDQLLDNREANIDSNKANIKRQSGQIESFIQKVVAPHVETGTDSDLDRLLSMLDSEMEKLMRAILHNPDFQALEANWRALFDCVTRLELDEQLTLYILDISQDNLATALLAQESIENSWLFSTVVENRVNTIDGEPWAVLAGLYYFGTSENDAALLSAMGAVASRAGGTFIAAPNDSFLAGIQEEASTTQKQWQNLRAQPQASYLGLVVPRLIMRQPYGDSSDEIDSFRFEELTLDTQGIPIHSQYLWGNGAIACLILLGQSFTHSAWDMRPGQNLDVTDLPFHSYKTQDEIHMKPCAEVILTERNGQDMLSLGFMPLLSYKNRNAVRLMAFQSIDKAGTIIQGAWSR